MNNIVISVNGLKKRYDEVQAIADMTFNLYRGELFGFLGPNGAGKTTTINILTGLARPDAGTIRIEGIDCIAKPRAAQDLIGVVPDESNLYPELTGYDNLCFCATLYGISKKERIKRANSLLKSFRLLDAAHRKFGTYSKGMKRKLTIAAGIIHQPQILFLDEPTTGIDVASARQIRQLIADLHDQGTTIFLTTHYIEEAERLCDRIAFIVNGRIVRTDTVENLIQPLQDKRIMHFSFKGNITLYPDILQNDFPDLKFTLLNKEKLRVESTQPIKVGKLIRYLEEQELEITEAKKTQPSLEDIFVKITGIEADIIRKEKLRGN